MFIRHNGSPWVSVQSVQLFLAANLKIVFNNHIYLSSLQDPALLAARSSATVQEEVQRCGGRGYSQSFRRAARRPGHDPVAQAARVARSGAGARELHEQVRRMKKKEEFIILLISLLLSNIYTARYELKI